MLNFIYSKKLGNVFQSFLKNLDNLDVFLSQNKRQELNDAIKSDVDYILSCDKDNKLYTLIKKLFNMIDKDILNYIDNQKALALTDIATNSTLRNDLNSLFKNLYLKYILEHISFEKKAFGTCFNNISTWLMLKSKQQKALEEIKAFIEILKLTVIINHNDKDYYSKTFPKISFLLNKLNLSRKSYEKLFLILLDKEDFKKNFGKELESIFISKLYNIHITINSGILNNLTQSFQEDNSSAKTVFNISCKYSYEILYNNISDAIKNCEEKINLVIEDLFKSVKIRKISDFYNDLKENPNLFGSDYYTDVINIITSNIYFSICYNDLIDSSSLIICLKNIIQRFLNNLFTIKEPLFSKHLLENLISIEIANELEWRNSIISKTIQRLDLNSSNSLVHYKKCLNWYETNRSIMAEKKGYDVRYIILSSLHIDCKNEPYNTIDTQNEEILYDFFSLIKDYLIKYYLSMPKDMFENFYYFFEK